jgi:hypothetical protein
MIDSGRVRSEGRRHGRLEKRFCPPKHRVEVEGADAVDNGSQRARRRRHGRHPSRHSYGSSNTSGISSHRDEVPAKHSSNGASNEFNVSPPRATKTLMLLPKYPPIVDHVLFQPMVQENPRVQEQPRVDFLDHVRDLKRPITGYNAPFLASMPKLDIHKLQAISLLVLTKSSSMLCQTSPMILLLLLTQNFCENCQLSKKRPSGIE